MNIYKYNFIEIRANDKSLLRFLKKALILKYFRLFCIENSKMNNCKYFVQLLILDSVCHSF